MPKPPQPYPLFDNIEGLATTLSSWHNRYLQTLLDEAKAEHALASRFLLAYQGSLDTFTSYRREIERLCQWAWLVQKKSLHNLDRDDIAQYLKFVQNPPKEWISSKHAARFIDSVDGERVPSSDWRPFLQRNSKNDVPKMGMQQATLRAVIASISTFFTYLMQEGYVNKNPVILLRQKGQILQKQQQTRITRKLTENQWYTTITLMKEKALINNNYERHLFALSAFYLMGVRISELAETPNRNPQMRDFFRDHDGLWWFQTVGKGNKQREIAVADSMLEALRRFRQHLGLAHLPSPNESTPIIPKQRGIGGVGVRQLRKIVQEAFDIAINKLEEDGQREESNHLRNATVHWLRHTAISHDVQHRPREHVRDDAGHQSINITDKYIDIDVKARHASAQSKTLISEQREGEL